MTRNTIIKNDIETTEIRYFISSIALDVNEIARVIRKYWMVESFHWHLDVTSVRIIIELLKSKLLSI